MMSLLVAHNWGCSFQKVHIVTSDRQPTINRQTIKFNHLGILLNFAAD